MKSETFHRLHNLRMENDAAGFAMEEMKPRFQQIADRHENGTAPRAVTAFQLFQTPELIAQKLVELLDCEPGATVLEPSAGLGRLLDALKPTQPQKVVAIEKDKNLSRELFNQNRENVTLLQRDFLTVDQTETGLFDSVIMNPPFHIRADIKHINHALNFVKPGGRLAGICLDTDHREKAFQHIASHWEKMPSGTFKNEGTNVPTVLFLIENPQP